MEMLMRMQARRVLRILTQGLGGDDGIAYYRCQAAHLFFTSFARYVCKDMVLTATVYLAVVTKIMSFSVLDTDGRDFLHQILLTFTCTDNLKWLMC